jgi:hypothetical protein
MVSMTHSNSNILIDDERWSSAVRKERVLRGLCGKRLKPDEIRDGCKELGISRAQLFRLLRRFEADPRASALVPRKPGPAKGMLMLEGAVEDHHRKCDQIVLPEQAEAEDITIASDDWI